MIEFIVIFDIFDEACYNEDKLLVQIIFHYFSKKIQAKDITEMMITNVSEARSVGLFKLMFQFDFDACEVFNKIVVIFGSKKYIKLMIDFFGAETFDIKNGIKLAKNVGNKKIVKYLNSLKK